MFLTRDQIRLLGDWVFLFCLSAVIFLSYLGNGSLASWDEAIYATVAKEIVRSGDWFRLTFLGQPWSDKPPLAIWFTALFYKFFGIGEFSARLFSALCGVGTVFATFLFGRKLFGKWIGFLGAAALATSTHFFRFARFGMMDVPLTFFMTLALYFFWLGREKNHYLVFSGVMIGLAVMTKGFAAFLLFPVIWIYCALAGELRVICRSSYWIGVAVAAAIALPWNLWETFSHRELYVQDVIVRHFFARMFHAIEGHAGGFYFYIRTFINKYHPWALVAVVSAPLFLYRSIKERKEEFLFPAVWIFFILAAITVIRTKLPWYILPIYPALSVTVGYALEKLFREERRWTVYALLIVTTALQIHYAKMYRQDYSHAIKALAPVIKKAVPEDAKLYLHNYHETPAAAFYLDRFTEYLDDKEALIVKANDNPFYCLVRTEDLKLLEDALASKGVSEAGGQENLHLLVKKTPSG